MDYFKINGPTCISFSGGRTSAYMLWRVLQSNGGLPADSHVVYANTGKEKPATLDFVHLCSKRWGITIDWVEYAPDSPIGYAGVSYYSASRNSEPFDLLIDRKGKYLPNPVERFCTSELKIIPAINFMRHMGYAEYDNLIGMRADEPSRVAKIRANPSGGAAGVDRRTPLADIGIGKHDVAEFWRAQPFDLALPLVSGKTIGGNCDLCFNKTPWERLSLIKDDPKSAIWWIGKEDLKGARFAKDGPSYRQLADFARDQRDMFDPEQEAISCFCGD